MNTEKPFNVHSFLISTSNELKKAQAKVRSGKVPPENQTSLTIFEDLTKELGSVEIKLDNTNSIIDVILAQGSVQQLFAFLCLTRLFDVQKSRVLHNLTFDDFAKEIPDLRKILDRKKDQKNFLLTILATYRIQVSVDISKEKWGKRLHKTTPLIWVVYDDEKNIVKIELLPLLSTEEFSHLSTLNMPQKLLTLAPKFKDDQCLRLALYFSEQFARNPKRVSFERTFENLFEVLIFSKTTKKADRKKSIISYLKRLSEEPNCILKPIKNLEDIGYSEKIRFQSGKTDEMQTKNI